MSPRSVIVIVALAVVACCCVSPAELCAADPPLKVVDERLQIDLVAESPRIVTPTGIAVAADGSVLVVESHTHFPPKDYKGLKADRILRMRDTNGDSAADEITTFYEGTKHTMNLAVHPSGAVYVATRMEIFRLRDTDKDGVADERTPIAHLETPGDYPHNGLSGFAIDFAGDLYFGFGENLGAEYKLIGSDGTTLSGGGEGGNVYFCKADGSGLRRVATGFWNPFHVCLDIYGRLFAVDNDPDSRPPCRLLHVVEGGDYGFRFRLGRKGTHPFIAWNGELAGTLPMVAGTGEAPSGILFYESDGLPKDYLGDILGTSWGDHRIERYHLEPRGASFVSTMKPVVVGGENFRPVGIACAPDGSLYISDWVDKSYNVHGKGRVWRLRAKEAPSAEQRNANRADPADPTTAIRSVHRPNRESAARALAETPAGRKALLDIAEMSANVRERATAIVALAGRPLELPVKQLLGSEADDNLRVLLATRPRAADSPRRIVNPNWAKSAPLWAAVLASDDFEVDEATRLAALAHVDPFVRHAARQGLLREFRARGPVKKEDLAKLWTTAPAPERLLLLRATGEAEARAAIPDFLASDDPGVRVLAAQWIGEEQLKQYAELLDVSRAVNVPSKTLLEAVLTAQAMLDNPKAERPGEELIARLAVDGKQSPAIRSMALRAVRPDHPALTSEMLFDLARGDDASLQLEAIRSLRERGGSGQPPKMIALARDDKLPLPARIEASLGVPPDNHENRGALLDWATTADLPLASEAVRSLRRSLGEGDKELRGKLAARFPDDAAWQSLVAFAAKEESQPPHPFPPFADLPAWVERAKAGTPDIAAGERLFFHPRVASCYRCHQVDGRGGKVGPDLTLAGKAMTVERLVESIVQPSREIAPQFTSWQVTLADGRQFLGLLGREELDGTQVYLTPEAKEIRVKPAEIDDRRPSQKSLMPDGLAATLTPEELRDLVAFLAKKRGS